MRESRRYNPLRKAMKKVDSDSEGWDRTLVRFRAHLDTICGFQNGQPSGGFVPETALARLSKFVKEDLKRSVSDFFLLRFHSSSHKFVNLATAALQHEGRRGKALEGCGNIP